MIIIILDKWTAPASYCAKTNFYFKISKSLSPKIHPLLCIMCCSWVVVKLLYFYLLNSWWENIYTSPFPCFLNVTFSSYKSDFTSSSSIMLSPSVWDVASPDCVANWRGPWGEPELLPFKDSLCIHKPPRSTADRLKFAAVATGTRCVWSRYFCNDKQPYVISNQTLEGSN